MFLYCPCSLLTDHPHATLNSLGVEHGDLLFLKYDIERQVEPAYKPKPYETRPFGSSVSVSAHGSSNSTVETGLSFGGSGLGIEAKVCARRWSQNVRGNM